MYYVIHIAIAIDPSIQYGAYALGLNTNLGFVQVYWGAS